MYGSLGATGKGHGTDKAVLLGLLGHEPDTVDVERIGAALKQVRDSKRIALFGTHEVAFNEKTEPHSQPAITCDAHGTPGSARVGAQSALLAAWRMR